MTNKDICTQIIMIFTDFCDYLYHSPDMKPSEFLYDRRNTVEKYLEKFVKENVTNPKYKPHAVGALWECRDAVVGAFGDGMTKGQVIGYFLGIDIDCVM